MALQISEFAGAAIVRGMQVDMPDGAPIKVTNVTGAYTVGNGANLVRIKGTGTITWAGVATAESFDGTEFRAVLPGQAFTVA